MNEPIGFMQGRLSPLVDGKTQAFPWENWRTEFPAAQKLGLHIMEWTLDQDRLYQNPLLTSQGQQEIRELCARHDMIVASMTGDCFMQAPFWKTSGKARTNLQSDFLAIARACAAVGIRMMVIPLVDNGQLETSEEENILVDFLLEQRTFLDQHNLQVLFESDYAPTELARFIGRLPSDKFGINYDIGNSAALGFNPSEEFSIYGMRVVNVHIKDRILGGTSVPLKAGTADFDAVFVELARQNYLGNFILQTARSLGTDHAEVLDNYRKMTCKWIKKYFDGAHYF